MGSSDLKLVRIGYAPYERDETEVIRTGRVRRLMVTDGFAHSRPEPGFRAPTVAERLEFTANTLERTQKVTRDAMMVELEGTNVSRELATVVLRSEGTHLYLYV